MNNLKILVANNHLSAVGGSETFTYTLLEEIKSLGFDVEYFTFQKGFTSHKIEKDLGIPFMSRNKYDLILASHNTCVELLYKKGFIVQTCHGIFPKLEQPSQKANAYVSISEEVQNHLATMDIPSLLIHNSINLERFKPVKPINSKLTTVLSLCHSTVANDLLRDACEEMNINFIKAYKYDDNPLWKVEEIINQADLVVGLGRSAFEGMACGRPVVIYDNRKYFNACGDGYIREILGFSLKNNCSGRYSSIQFDKKSLMVELLKFDSTHGEYFRDFAIRELDVKKNFVKYLNYVDALQKHRKNRRKKNFMVYGQNILGHTLFNKIKWLYNISNRNFRF